MMKERKMPRTGQVVVPKGRQSSATARKTIGSGAQPDRSPMMDHVGKRPRNT